MPTYEKWTGSQFSAEGVARLNRTGDKLMKVPDEKGGGYSALLEVFHQIHCLASQAYTLLEPVIKPLSYV